MHPFVNHCENLLGNHCFSGLVSFCLIDVDLAEAQGSHSFFGDSWPFTISLVSGWAGVLLGWGTDEKRPELVSR